MGRLTASRPRPPERPNSAKLPSLRNIIPAVVVENGVERRLRRCFLCLKRRLRRQRVVLAFQTAFQTHFKQHFKHRNASGFGVVDIYGGNDRAPFNRAPCVSGTCVVGPPEEPRAGAWATATATARAATPSAPVTPGAPGESARNRSQFSAGGVTPAHARHASYGDLRECDTLRDYYNCRASVPSRSKR